MPGSSPRSLNGTASSITFLRRMLSYVRVEGGDDPSGLCTSVNCDGSGRSSLKISLAGRGSMTCTCTSGVPSAPSAAETAGSNRSEERRVGKEGGGQATGGVGAERLVGIG